MTDKARESLKYAREDLEEIDKQWGFEVKEEIKEIKETFNIISQALDHADNLEETMKLIVKKRVNIPYLIELIKTPSRYGALHNYNCDYDEGDFRRLTETEFNQIKEVIEKYGK